MAAISFVIDTWRSTSPWSSSFVVVVRAFGQRSQRSSSQDGEVAGQCDVGIGRIETGPVDQLGGQFSELIVQASGDQPLVHPWLKVHHVSECTKETPPGARMDLIDRYSTLRASGIV
jgi:hypothetical protein